LQTYQLSNVQILEADAAHLPFEDKTFDLIVSNLGINNFTDPSAVLAECSRVAKLKAHIVLTTNPIGHMAEFYEVFRQMLLELQKPAYLERLRTNEAHRGTKESLSDLLQERGFRITRVREDRFQLRYLDGSALFNHPLTKLGFLDGWRRVVDQEDEEHIFALLENKLNQIARAQGELCMTVPMLYLEGEKPD
jgi:SAM-dependent methyltransferase